MNQHVNVMLFSHRTLNAISLFIDTVCINVFPPHTLGPTFGWTWTTRNSLNLFIAFVSSISGPGARSRRFAASHHFYYAFSGIFIIRLLSRACLLSPLFPLWPRRRRVYEIIPPRGTFIVFGQAKNYVRAVRRRPTHCRSLRRAETISSLPIGRETGRRCDDVCVSGCTFCADADRRTNMTLSGDCHRLGAPAGRVKRLIELRRTENAHSYHSRPTVSFNCTISGYFIEIGSGYV